MSRYSRHDQSIDSKSFLWYSIIMSELLEYYKSQMPEKCLKCPIFLAYMTIAEKTEAHVASIVEAMEDAVDNGGPFENEEANRITYEMHSNILDIAAGSERYADKVLNLLSSAGADCPTPKISAPENVSLGWKINAWIRREKLCRNPNFTSIYSID
jgi:hypothetical protein